jgi:hypothetical protein
LKNQLIDGSWSMLEIDSTITKYGSTYSTCHAILALHSSYPHIADVVRKEKVKLSISKGVEWLLNNYTEGDKLNTIIWRDYPNGNTVMSIKSLGLTGLAIHTLNVTGHSTSLINQKWLNNLDNNRPLSIDVTYRELSNMQYKIIGVGFGDKYQDNTRHLEIPWTIIATIDAYKDATFMQKINASIWASNMVKKLDYNEISKELPFVRAEVLIGLKYLTGDYSFDNLSNSLKINGPAPQYWRGIELRVQYNLSSNSLKN